METDCTSSKINYAVRAALGKEYEKWRLKLRPKRTEDDRRMSQDFLTLQDEEVPRRCTTVWQCVIGDVLDEDAREKLAAVSEENPELMEYIGRKVDVVAKVRRNGKVWTVLGYAVALADSGIVLSTAGNFDCLEIYDDYLIPEAA